MARHFPFRESQGILNRLEKSGEIAKYWKSPAISGKCYLLFLVIFINERCISCQNASSFQLKMKIILEIWGNNCKSLRNFVNSEKWESCLVVLSLVSLVHGHAAIPFWMSPD